MGNSGETDKATEQLEQLVRMGTLDANEVSITASAAIATAQKDSDTGREREKSYRDLMMQLDSVNEFLKRLDTMIAEAEAELALLLARQAEALIQAEFAFDRMHEAEDLMNDIRDGISSDERLRLIELIGVDPENMTVEELTILLQDEMRTSHKDGLDKTDEAEGIEKEIQAERDWLENARAQREAYANANTAEERRAIEAAMPELSPKDEPDLHEEVTFGATPLLP